MKTKISSNSSGDPMDICQTEKIVQTSPFINLFHCKCSTNSPVAVKISNQARVYFTCAQERGCNFFCWLDEHDMISIIKEPQIVIVDPDFFCSEYKRMLSIQAKHDEKNKIPERIRHASANIPKIVMKNSIPIQPTLHIPRIIFSKLMKVPEQVLAVPALPTACASNVSIFLNEIKAVQDMIHEIIGKPFIQKNNLIDSLTIAQKKLQSIFDKIKDKSI